MSMDPNRKLLAIAKKLKVEIESPYKESGKVNRIRFDFEPEVWADLANREGELLPICCANVSAMRDEFVEAMREDGWMDADGVQKLVINMSGHDYKEDHPASVVKRAYLMFQGKWQYTSLAQPDTLHDLNNPEDACNHVYFGRLVRYCTNFSVDSMFSGFGNSMHDRANRNHVIFEMVPVIKTLRERLHEAAFEPVEGYALVRRANGKVYEHNRGLAIYDTEDTANEVFAYWIKDEQVKPYEVDVRSVRVSWDKGIEILDTVPSPFVKPSKKPEISKDEQEKIWDTINALRDETKSDKVEVILWDALTKIRALGDDE